jgi:ketosteroid isomerase-like protein
MEAAVHAYVAAFEAGSADQVAALYAQDATVEDPIGSPIHKGREAVRAFYAESMKTGAKLKLEGPVRIAGDYAVFPFSVNLNYDGGPSASTSSTPFASTRRTRSSKCAPIGAPPTCTAFKHRAEKPALSHVEGWDFSA